MRSCIRAGLIQNILVGGEEGTFLGLVYVSCVDTKQVN